MTDLASLLRDAANGRLPPRDGIHVVAAPDGPADAVVSFPFHSVIATSAERTAVLDHLDADDPGAALRADFVAWLAQQVDAKPGSIDVVMTLPTGGGRSPAPELPFPVRRLDCGEHPRLARASRYRRDVRAVGDDGGRSVATAGRGLAGRWEISFELDERWRGNGLGAPMALTAAALVPAGEPVVAQVAPANVSSLRALLSAGFTPIGAEVLLLRR